MKFNLTRIIKRLVPIILIGITGNILFTIYTSEDDLLDSLLSFTPSLFILALILSLIPWAGHALRTYIWASFLGHPISFKNSFRIALAHDLGGAITPTVVGGTPIKFGLIHQNGVPGAATGMIIVLQVLEDLVFVLSSLPLSLYLSGGFDNPMVTDMRSAITANLIHLTWVIPTLVVLILLARLIFKNKVQNNQAKSPDQPSGLKAKLFKSWADFKAAGKLIVSQGKLRFLLTALMMYAEWSCRFFIPVVLVIARGVVADPFQLFFLHWLVWFAMLVIPTPGATGGAEATFYFLFVQVVPKELMGILITGWRFVSYYFMMLVGAILLQSIGVMDEDPAPEKVAQSAA